VSRAINPDDNNSNFIDELKPKGHLFLYYQSKIIVEIFSYLEDHDNKEIEDLFSNAVDLFNSLGSWIYGGISPKIVYPELQLFVRKANTTSAESFSHLLNYINWMGNILFKILEDNQWIEEYYYESFTLKQSNEVTTGLLFMWRLGWLIVKIKEISDENNISLGLQFLNAFDNLFDAFGEWIFHQEDLVNITQRFQQFEKILGKEIDPLYAEIIEEAKNTRKNIAKFLQTL
jgi:hypothetical protein